uniref:Uncharacterized protein n=1 Tax=Anopheles dirus TaxID=7168 RepID=A0A182NHX8_9DIPT
IIRKLSFNPTSATTGSSGGTDQSPTNNGGHGLNNRITAKYVLHKNCTPTRCKVQPGDASTVDDVSVAGWMETRMAGESRSPSPPAIPATQNNYRPSRSMKNLPKKRTNITSNKNVNLRKCFRLRSKTFDGPLSTVTVGSGSPGVGPLGSSPSLAEEPDDGGRREVVAVPADSMTLASNNSSSRLIGSKLDKISKSLMRSGDGEGGGGVGGGGGPSLEIAKPLFLKQYEIDTDVVWRSTRCSSRRTSASTVETWIDDETFDNSFNEELERRCVTLKICE